MVLFNKALRIHSQSRPLDYNYSTRELQWDAFIFCSIFHIAFGRDMMPWLFRRNDFNNEH